jgi:hypothetical protein
MRFGQVHGAGPLAADHLGQIQRLLFLGAADLNGFHRAAGQAGVHGERHVGRGHHLADRQPQHIGQALAAVIGIADQTGPAAIDHSVIGFLEPDWGGDLAVFQPAAFPVADLIQRLQHFLTELGRALQNGGDGIRRRVGETGQITSL